MIQLATWLRIYNNVKKLVYRRSKTASRRWLGRSRVRGNSAPLARPTSTATRHCHLRFHYMLFSPIEIKFVLCFSLARLKIILSPYSWTPFVPWILSQIQQSPARCCPPPLHVPDVRCLVGCSDFLFFIFFVEMATRIANILYTSSWWQRIFF